MADTLSPEQRAYDICEALHLRHGWVQREIADAIRAAETAAVEAERSRCAKEVEAWASEIREENTYRGRVNQVAEHAAEMVEAAAKRIRRTPTTEADNAR